MSFLSITRITYFPNTPRGMWYVSTGTASSRRGHSRLLNLEDYDYEGWKVQFRLKIAPAMRSRNAITFTLPPRFSGTLYINLKTSRMR